MPEPTAAVDLCAGDAVFGGDAVAPAVDVHVADPYDAAPSDAALLAYWRERREMLHALLPHSAGSKLAQPAQT